MTSEPRTETTTVVFADLTGSTGVFEALGNSLATQAITTLTHWIGSVCAVHGGRVVKTLGDGVLAVFPDGGSAIAAVVELQRIHNQRLQEWPNNLRMRLQVGVASGEVIEVDGDCYGDAVNVASRLSDLSGADQIWATDTVISQVDDPGPGVRFLSLGAIQIRGKVEPRIVYRADWQEDSETVNLTAPASLQHLRPVSRKAAEPSIELSWLDQRATFAATQMPLHLGRGEEAQFIVNDQRVSRLHARLDWKNGGFVLTDLSSYGTWVKFQGSTTELALRRDECMLHAAGELALGAPFHDFTVPTVVFQMVSAPP
ncbi:MAG: adenylate/guanylate cyclase domain-containing protein [Pseudomonadota bacterium]